MAIPSPDFVPAGCSSSRRSRRHTHNRRRRTHRGVAVDAQLRVELLPMARDVFMDDGDEKNLFVFRRDGDGRVTELVERRKFNDLVLKREIR